MLSNICSPCLFLSTICFAFLLLSPTHSAAAPSAQTAQTASNECIFEWNVTARGIALGITRDTVRWSPTSNSVVSFFTPNAVAAMLGAPSVERRWSMSSDKKITRGEKRYNGKKEIESESAKWMAKGNELWQINTLGESIEATSPQGIASSRYIDSSVFAYLALIGQPLEEGTGSVWVMTRSTPYQASTLKNNETMQYSSGNKRGTVWVSASKPTKMSFSEGADKFEASVVSSNCN